jgi:4-amino-4-deoxy-L-arabinose transferase-like glycosyltransferase
MDGTFGPSKFGRKSDPSQGFDPGRTLVSALDYAVASHRRAVALLILCGLLFFLPGFFSIPPVDRDEARFAQATRQMLESKDFVDIRFQDEVRYKKPVGIYWMQAAAVSLGETLGVPGAKTRIALYRIPSLIGAIGAVLLTYWAALAFVTRRGAIIAALLMCSSVLLGVEARLAKTDAMLLLVSVAALGAMARVYLAWQRGEESVTSSWLVPGIFWTALAVGILVKGPLILMLVILPTIALAFLDKSIAWWSRLKPLPGVLWMVLLAAPWFVLILMRSGDSFLAGSLGQDMFSKVVGGQESHGAPPGLYFLLFWVTFWPGAVLAGMAAPAVWQARREPGAQFLLAWLVPSWIVFELVMTKLPHYVLPLYPAIAILIVGVLERRTLSEKRWLTIGSMSWFVLPVVLALLGVVGAVALVGHPVFAAWPFIAGALVLGLFAWLLFDERRAERSVLTGIAASFFIALGLYQIVLPTLRPVFPSVTMARVLRDSPCNAPRATAAGYHEPSLIFLTETSTHLTDGSGAADFLRQGFCRYAFVEARHERSFAQRAQAIGLRYAAAGRIEGYNYSQGREISVAIYRSDTQP